MNAINPRGKVSLVGAGPGGIGLLTLRGKQVIEGADVVLFDRLVNPEILDLIPSSATRIDVGKSRHNHPVPQNQINALLLRLAEEGKRVVRLKGGDPYLFGRGAEELEAVIAADIPFEVVPGVTSAIAVPAFAGIPVTHREFASSMHVITAHRKDGAIPDLDYQTFVKLKGTLIFLMGVNAIGAITSGLMSAGLAPDTPAALIENGARSNQRALYSTVSEIAAESKVQAFAPPSILVIGGVCSLADRLDWSRHLPLRGVGVIVTRPRGQDTLSNALRELGAGVTHFPCIRTEPLTVSDSVFQTLAEQDWIVCTSPTGAAQFFEELTARGMDIRSLHRVKFAAIGEKTAEIFRRHAVCADYVPTRYNASALAEGLPYSAGAARVLLFRAQSGTPELITTLETRGFSVTDVAAYQTHLLTADVERVRSLLQAGDVRFVTFTSASTVQGFVDALPDMDLEAASFQAVCIGEETAAVARRYGFRVLVSEKATIDSMVSCILEQISL